MSICTGAFVLAAARRLDGRPATTHWMHTAKFQQFFPAVRLDPDVLYVDDGDVLTSAGNAAGIDLCLHLVRRDHGLAVATGWPGAVLCRRGGRAGSRSSSSRWPTSPGRTRPRPARGRWTGSTSPSASPTSPRTPP